MEGGVCNYPSQQVFFMNTKKDVHLLVSWQPHILNNILGLSDFSAFKNHYWYLWVPLNYAAKDKAFINFLFVFCTFNIVSALSWFCFGDQDTTVNKCYHTMALLQYFNKFTSLFISSNIFVIKTHLFKKYLEVWATRYCFISFTTFTVFVCCKC